jgi:autotransporter-associated beta strand protein
VPTTIGTDVIELTADAGRWRQDRTLSLFYQPQVGGNASTVSVLEWSTQQALGRVLKWTGQNSAEWNTSAVNFADHAVADNFDNFDNVTFDDAGAHKTVQIANSLAAGKVVVDTTQVYAFEGNGLTAGSLAVVGGGTLELRNSGNTYTGTTRVSNATLKILGNANGMRSKIDVATGGVVILDPTSTATMTSNFDVWKTGELRVGSPTSADNIWPANGNSLVNDGIVRVFTSETLTNVRGDGAIIAQARTLAMHSNPNFSGTVAAETGATVVAGNSSAFGSAGIDVSGNGTGQGAVRIMNGSQIVSSQPSTVRTAAAGIFVDSGAKLTLSQVGGPGGLLKSGTGDLQLNSDANYAGDTVVQAGTLIVEGTTGVGLTHVHSGASLAGRGRIRNDLVAHSNSTIRPTAVNVTALGGPNTIDDFNDGNLSEYTHLTLLNFDNVVESTFSAVGGALSASTTDTGNSPEQSALVRSFGGLGVGDMIVVDAAINANNSTALPVRLFDYGLMIADSDDLKAGTREKYLYAASRLSSNPDIMLARYWDSDPVDGSAADVNVNDGAGTNIESPRATQFFIRRVGQTVYQLGYSTNNLQTLMQYGSNINVEPSFEPDLVGFYSDPRGGDGVSAITANSGAFDNLRLIRSAIATKVFTVEGDFTMQPGAKLDIEILNDHEYGTMVIDGVFLADGMLRVVFGGAYQPGAGDKFDILHFSASSGIFEVADLPALPIGLIWDTSQLMTDGQLSVDPGIAGDYNRNGVVDSADYISWRKSFGSHGVGLAADGNADLRVDQGDFDLFRLNFGRAANQSTGTIAIPEARSLLLIAIATILCTACSRQGSRS